MMIGASCEDIVSGKGNTSTSRYTHREDLHSLNENDTDI